MSTPFLMSDSLAQIIIIVMLLSPFVFLVGLILAAVSKDTRKLGIKLIIGSVIAFVVGFGTCVASA